MRKTEKAFVCLALALILAFAWPGFTRAQGFTAYPLDDTGLTVSLPSGYIVFTRDTSDDDPNLARYALTKDAVVSMLKANQAYLIAWDEAFSFEVSVISAPSPMDDLSRAGEALLTSIADSLVYTYRSQGIPVVRRDTYRTGGAVYQTFAFTVQNAGVSLPGLIYSTIIGGRAVSFTGTSHQAEVRPQDEALMKSMADSLTVGSVPASARENTVKSEAFSYSDDLAGIAFTVPSGWTKLTAPVVDNARTALFMADAFSGATVLLASYDAWIVAADAPRGDVSRLFTGNTDPAEEAVESAIKGFESTGYTRRDIEVVSYGGYHYYRARFTYDAAGEEMADLFTSTQLIRLHNGRLYTFYVTGASDGPFWADIDQLMASVRFPD